MDIALKLDPTNLEKAFGVLRDLVGNNSIHNVGSPIPTGRTAGGQTASFVMVAPDSPVLISYGADGPDSYPRNVPTSDPVAVGGVNIAVPPLLTAAANIHITIQGGISAEEITPEGGLILHEVQNLVRLIGQASATGSPPQASRRTPPGLPPHLRRPGGTAGGTGEPPSYPGSGGLRS
ncbi:MAG: hypothetical protein ACRD3Q_19250 [Terriglobales bacterium]